MNRIEKLEQIIISIKEKIFEIIQKKPTIKKENEDYQLLLLFYFIRLHETIISILLLTDDKHKLYEDALTICRILFEMAVNVKYIKHHKTNGVQMIFNTAESEEKKILDAFNKTTTPKVTNTLPNIIVRINKISEGKTEYIVLYRLLSQSVHPTPTSLKKFLAVDEKTRKAKGVHPNIKDKENALLVLAFAIDVIFPEMIKEFDLLDEYRQDFLAFHNQASDIIKNPD